METVPTNRPFTDEDYKAIWNRRKWWFLGPSALLAALTCVVVGFLRSYYRSQALVLIEQPEVSQQYVKPVVAVDTDQTLSGLIQEVMSRTLIARLPYFQTGGAASEDAMADFEKDASIEILRGNSDPRRPAGKPYGLKVSYLGTSPRQAQEVTNELATLLVQEGDRVTLALAQATTRMLRTQLTAAASSVQDKGQALEDFKKRYAGQLPIEEQLTIETLTHLEGQLDAESQAIERDRQSMADLPATLQPLPTDESKSSDPQGSASSRLETDVQSLRGHLVELESRYKPTHPDVIRTQEQIRRLEAQVAAEKAKSAASRSVPPKSAKTSSQTPMASGPRIQDLQAELAVRQEKRKQIEQRMAHYQANLSAIPLHGQQFADLQRDYDAAKKDYESLRDKVTEAEQSTDVFQQQEGVRLRIQDYASLPASPDLPVRWKINLGGLGASVLLGLVLAAFLELRDTSMKSEVDVEFYTGLTNLALFPDYPTLVELKRARRKKLAWITSTAIVALVLAGLNYYLYVVRL